MTLGEKIVKCRDFLGISQAELARRSRVTGAAISQYENNKRLPDIKSFQKIRLAFGMSHDGFMKDVRL